MSKDFVRTGGHPEVFRSKQVRAYGRQLPRPARRSRTVIFVQEIRVSEGPNTHVRQAETKLFRTTFVRSLTLSSKECSILGPAGRQDRD